MASGELATGYLFAEVPTARMGIAKSASALTDNSDGTHSVTFTFTVENAGGTPLDTVQITDSLAAFGTYTSNAVPTPGQYSISSGLP